MLMSISFPAIIDEWVECVSLATSLRNEGTERSKCRKYSKTSIGCQPYFEKTCPVLRSQVRREHRFVLHWVSPCCDASSFAWEFARFASMA